MGGGDAWGANQRNAIALVSGAASIARNKPLRPPNWRGAEFVAKSIRESHAALGPVDHSDVAKPTKHAELEARCVSRLAISMMHCRDLRTLRLCLMPALWCFASITGMAIEVSDAFEAPPHVFYLERRCKSDVLLAAPIMGRTRRARITQRATQQRGGIRRKTFGSDVWNYIAPRFFCRESHPGGAHSTDTPQEG